MEAEKREQMILNNLGLVWSIVHRFQGRGCETEDLFQIGTVGLIKAIDNFDTSFQVKFSTYAVPMITGEIRRHLRDNGMIRVSRSLKESGWQIARAREELSSRNGREPTLQELSEHTGLSVEDIVMAIDANAEVDSIYRTVYQGDGQEIQLADQIADQKNEKEMIINRIFLQEMMNQLEEKEQQLILLRYFRGKTQTEVAKQLCMTQVQVSRLEKKILARMREEG